MPNSYFQFKQFIIHQEQCAMKVTTDACLFGAWITQEFKSDKIKVKNVLDAGTGTGLLSLMFAQKNHSLTIDAIEIDEETYKQAKENVAISPFAQNIKVIHGDIKTISFLKKYDLIISNPPFYENEIRSSNERKNIAHHNSGLLLDELLGIIKKNLSSSGRFYLLLPFKRSEEIKTALFKQDLFILEIVFIRQSTKHDYFRLMIKGKSKKHDQDETIIDEISIWNDQQQYTKDFTGLLKDYYLYL